MFAGLAFCLFFAVSLCVETQYASGTVRWPNFQPQNANQLNQPSAQRNHRSPAGPVNGNYRFQHTLERLTSVVSQLRNDNERRFKSSHTKSSARPRASSLKVSGNINGRPTKSPLRLERDFRHLAPSREAASPRIEYTFLQNGQLSMKLHHRSDNYHPQQQQQQPPAKGFSGSRSGRSKAVALNANSSPSSTKKQTKPSYSTSSTFSFLSSTPSSISTRGWTPMSAAYGNEAAENINISRKVAPPPPGPVKSKAQQPRRTRYQRQGPLVVMSEGPPGPGDPKLVSRGPRPAELIETTMTVTGAQRQYYRELEGGRAPGRQARNHQANYSGLAIAAEATTLVTGESDPTTTSSPAYPAGSTAPGAPSKTHYAKGEGRQINAGYAQLQRINKSSSLFIAGEEIPNSSEATPHYSRHNLGDASVEPITQLNSNEDEDSVADGQRLPPSPPNEDRDIILRPSPSSAQDDEDNRVGQTPRAVDIQVTCLSKEEMLVAITFSQRFEGLVYAKGFFSDVSCHFVRPKTGKRRFEFLLKANFCGTTFSDDIKGDSGGRGGDDGDSEEESTSLENILIIQHDARFQEAEDISRHIQCSWSGTVHKSVVASVVVDQIRGRSLSYTADRVDTFMEIQVGEGPGAEAADDLVRIGDTITAVIYLKGDDAPKYDLHVKECVAHDGTSERPLVLTDDRGCVLRRSMMQPWVKRQDVNGSPLVAYSFIKAFRFPERIEVFFECNVELCKHRCTDQCPDDVFEDSNVADESKQRRRRLKRSHQVESKNSTVIMRKLRSEMFVV